MTTPSGAPTADADLMETERPFGVGGDTDRELIELCDKLIAAGDYARAAVIGRGVNDIDGRTCVVTGRRAGGYAFLPGTRLPVSHGMWDDTPTVYDKVVGVGTYWQPQIVNNKGFLDLRLGRVDPKTDNHGLPLAPLGGELLLARLGVGEGDTLTIEIRDDGVFISKASAS
jgi:hypothetical protein